MWPTWTCCKIYSPNLRSCGFLLNWLDFTREYSPNNSKCVTQCNADFLFFLVKKSWDELKYFWLVHQHKCCQLRWICNKQYSFKLCLQIICSSPNSYIFPWFLICKNITFLSKWMLFCQIKLEVDQILCWSNVWSCETMVKLSEEEMGGMPFQPLASYCSQQKERDGRKEWVNGLHCGQQQQLSFAIYPTIPKGSAVWCCHDDPFPLPKLERVIAREKERCRGRSDW